MQSRGDAVPVVLLPGRTAPGVSHIKQFRDRFRHWDRNPGHERFRPPQTRQAGAVFGNPIRMSLYRCSHPTDVGSRIGPMKREPPRSTFGPSPAGMAVGGRSRPEADWTESGTTTVGNSSSRLRTIEIGRAHV